MKELRTLFVRGTKLTEQDVAQLRKALPECQIVSDFKKGN